MQKAAQSLTVASSRTTSVDMSAPFASAQGNPGATGESVGEYDFGVPDFDLSQLLGSNDQFDMFSSATGQNAQSQAPAPSTNALAGMSYGSLVQTSSSPNNVAVHSQHPSLGSNGSSILLNSDQSSQGQVQLLQQKVLKDTSTGDQTTLLLREQLAKQIQLQKIQQLQNHLLQQQVRTFHPWGVLFSMILIVD